MSYEYTFSRELINNSYNIDNKLRVDVNGNQIFLSKEVEGVTNKKFEFFCDDDVAKFAFETELTPEEQTLLAEVVNNHKNNL